MVPYKDWLSERYLVTYTLHGGMGLVRIFCPFLAVITKALYALFCSIHKASVLVPYFVHQGKKEIFPLRRPHGRNE